MVLGAMLRNRIVRSGLVFVLGLWAMSSHAWDRDYAIEIVKTQHYEVWSRGNLERIPELYTTDFVGHFPGSTVLGLAGIKNRVIAHRKAFPDWTERVIDVIADQGRVVTRFLSTGTNEGPFRGEPPTGRCVNISEVAIYRMVEGKIAEQWVYPDMRAMQQQLSGEEKGCA